MPQRRKWVLGIWVPAVLFAIWLGVREIQDRTNKRRAYSVVRELGGRIGSITPPIPFSGSEIVVVFRDVELQKSGLQRLSVLNRLTSKHWVSLRFVDTNLSRREIIELRQMLPDCHVIVAGECHDDQ